IAVKEGMYWYTRIAGKKINSSALMADAWHHRTDALSSVGALLGILGAQHGFPWMDSLASVVIAIFVLVAAYKIFMDASDRVVDGVAEEEGAIREYACSIAHVDMLKTRKFGNRVYVDMEIGIDGNLSLYKAHEEAERIHDLIEAQFPDIKHILIHVNPLP
ncbi:MAG: cation transporter, partial [Eubacterium sp.]|nr:cation transporter [Candidatus Colimonas fimequi]